MMGGRGQLKLLKSPLLACTNSRDFTSVKPRLIVDELKMEYGFMVTTQFYPSIDLHGVSERSKN